MYQFRLQRTDGSPADPADVSQRTGMSWNVGDMRSNARVVDTRPVAGPGKTPIFVVEPEQA